MDLIQIGSVYYKDSKQTQKLHIKKTHKLTKQKNLLLNEVCKMIEERSKRNGYKKSNKWIIRK